MSDPKRKSAKTAVQLLIILAVAMSYCSSTSGAATQLSSSSKEAVAKEPTVEVAAKSAKDSPVDLKPPVEAGSSSLDAKKEASAAPTEKKPAEVEITAKSVEAKPSASEPQKPQQQEAQQSEPKRKARADSAESKSPEASSAASTSQASEKADSGSKASKAPQAPPTQPSKEAPKPSSSRQQPAKSSQANKAKSNLGTVTSTGSGSHSLFMSKHDAYSAIAEKHGALAQEAMRKSDKRRVSGGHVTSGGGGGFGGIQKASGGIGDMLNPFKGVTESGLARTLGASMRSIMKSKYSVPAYVASALLGAVALLAFYESPISPLPVPALPEPPVGRFPPEMPSLPAGTQVPFRINGNQYSQQSAYANQRTSEVGSYSPMRPQQSQPSQQVQQQRGWSSYSTGPANVVFPGAGSGGSDDQLGAAGFLSPKVAQRKSGSDFEGPGAASMRSLLSGLGASVGVASGNSMLKMTPVNQPQSKSSALLSFFGLGGGNGSGSGGGSSGVAASQTGSGGVSSSGLAFNQASPLQLASMQPLEAKAALAGQPAGGPQPGGSSNLVGKVKSLFAKASGPVVPSTGSSQLQPKQQQQQQQQPQQRMSFIQSLVKDTSFLANLLVPARKSSPVSSQVSPQQQVQLQQSQQQSSLSVAQPVAGPSSAARSSDDLSSQSQAKRGLQQQQQQQSPSSPSSSSYGLAKAADRIAHALLESFSTSLAQRGGQSQQQQVQQVQPSDSQLIARKSSALGEESSSLGPTGDATKAQASGSDLEQAVGSTGSQQQRSLPVQQRSGEAAEPTTSQEKALAPQSQTASVSSNNKDAQESRSSDALSQVASSPASGSQVRKTRSIGLEYSQGISEDNLSSQQATSSRLSRAAQINNVVDYVADSYMQNRLLFNFVMNQVGLSQAVPYVEQILGPARHQ